MDVLSSACGCTGWDLAWLMTGLVMVGIAGAWLAVILVPDFYWLGYGVVGDHIQVRLLHVLPIWFIPIRNVASIEASRDGVVHSNPLTWLLWFEITRTYVRIGLRRGMFWGLVRNLQITPFFAPRFVSRVRARMEAPERRGGLFGRGES